MGDVAIRVEGLSKQYRIGGKQERYKTLRDTLTDAFSSPFRRAAQLVRGQAYGAANLNETIWALKDVSFEVKKGEVVGIIGRNGAGKSTLLKILSRITESTSGYVEVFGRIGALLEVGTGFHPELTGRENIYLNGAILGMTRQEIDRKFDEIVDFAGVEKFIDTPVKHYSSGMALRLGFAVAAHLEPEILIVDEVLAVGDAAFQNKCLGKMSDVASSGRTVLFVSHNMAAVRSLCERSILLRSGTIHFEGATEETIRAYLNGSTDTATSSCCDTRSSTNRSGIGGGQIVRIGCCDEFGTPTSVIGIGQPFSIWADIEIHNPIRALVFGIELKTRDGIGVLNLRSDSQKITLGSHLPSTRVRIKVIVPGLPLYPDIYVIEPWFADQLGKRIDHVHQCLQLSLEAQGHFASEQLIQHGKGLILADALWAVDNIVRVETHS